MDIDRSMRVFSTHDLNKQVGEVTDAASKAPVVITRHRKPRFVMMSYEDFRRLRGGQDPRRVFGPGEAPAEITELFGEQIDRLARGNGYDAED